MRLWADQRLDIVCLQELWLKRGAQGARLIQQVQIRLDDAAAAGLGSPRYTAFWAPSNADASAGVAILIRTSLLDSGDMAVTPDSLHADPDGRLVSLRLRWGGHHILLVNAYLKSGDPVFQRAFIQDRLTPLLDSGGQADIILVGDFNLTDDWRADRTNTVQRLVEASTRHSQRLRETAEPSPAIPPPIGALPTPTANSITQRPDEERTAMAMQQLCSSSSLTDAFRLKHPTAHGYTFVGPTAASRLDRCYLPAGILPHLHQCEVISDTE